MRELLSIMDNVLSKKKTWKRLYIFIITITIISFLLLVGNANNITTKTYLAIQTFPLSSFQGNKIGDGWVAIMEFNNSNIHNPNVLAWSYNIETTGIFRLSKNTTTLKLHHNRTYSLGANNFYW